GREGAPTWSVLLATFAKEDHAAIAAAIREKIVKQYPTLKDCFVERVEKGSVILVGRFKGPDDPAAQAKLKEVKALDEGGHKHFAMAMLTRTSTTNEPPGPY